MLGSHDSPPIVLDSPLEIAPSDWSALDCYNLLTGLVVPRPIAWISTVSSDGVSNIAPHSFFNMVAADPPHVMISSTGVKDTLRNIRATNEFVLNIVTMEVVEKMVDTATNFPPNEDEFELSGLTPTPSFRVTPPRILESKAHLECVGVKEMEIGNAFLVFGKVAHVHVASSIWRNGRVDTKLLDPVCRLSGSGYAELGKIFKIPIPAWEGPLVTE